MGNKGEQEKKKKKNEEDRKVYRFNRSEKRRENYCGVCSFLQSTQQRWSVQLSGVDHAVPKMGEKGRIWGRMVR